MKVTLADAIAALRPRGQCFGCDRTIYTKSANIPRSFYTENGLTIANSATRCQGCAVWELRHPDQTIEQRRENLVMGKPAIGSTEWQSDAACKTADPTLFDEVEQRGIARSDGMYSREHAAAKEYCAKCPVALDCELFAEENRESGTRAGQYFIDGKAQIPLKIKEVAA